MAQTTHRCSDMAAVAEWFSQETSFAIVTWLLSQGSSLTALPDARVNSTPPGCRDGMGILSDTRAHQPCLRTPSMALLGLLATRYILGVRGSGPGHALNIK